MKQNLLHRYLFENLSIRGEIVQLEDVYQRISTSQNYPPQLKKLLGELLVTSNLLTATLKFEGSITIQLQGDGAVSLAVINSDHMQQVRGVARWDQNRWQNEIKPNATLHDMIGKGYLVITIEPLHGERYQGIVGLDGETLAEIVEGYFASSEQLKTRLWLATDETHAAGMMIQIVPDKASGNNDFSHLEQLTNTIKDEELLNLPAQDLLYRLYNQEKIFVYKPQPITFHCGCSRERTSAAIITLDPLEVNQIIQEDGAITLNCDYCGTSYSFEQEDVNQLYIDARVS